MNDVLQGFVDGLIGSSDHFTMLERIGIFTSSLTVSLLITIVTLIIATRARDAIQRVGKRRRTELDLVNLLGRVGYFGILFLGLILVLQVFGVDPTALFATLGVVGLAVSLAMQDVLKNIFAGIYLLIERPFRSGETIQVRTFTGVVETIDLRTTTLRAENEKVYVPNAILFAEVLVNRGEIRVEPIDSADPKSLDKPQPTTM